MKEYRIKENSPLKFHKFIWYVCMPISFLIAIRTAVLRITSIAKSYSNIDENQFATIVSLYIIFELVFIVIPVLVFVGFFRWKKYSWYLLVIKSIVNILCNPISLFLNLEILDGASVVGRVARFATDIFIVIYYWKRRRLFDVNFKFKVNVSVSFRDADAVPNVNYVAETPVESGNQILYCRQCGETLISGAHYCRFCGTEVEKGEYQ